MSKRKVTFQDGEEEFSLDDEVPKKKVRGVCFNIQITTNSSYQHASVQVLSHVTPSCTNQGAWLTFDQQAADMHKHASV